jgi:hypothetical protein
VKIVGILLRSLDTKEDVDEEKLDDALAKESARRVDEIRAGNVKLTCFCFLPGRRLPYLHGSR